MWKKICLYWNSVKFLKPCQVYGRIFRNMGIGCSLGIFPKKWNENTSIHPISTITELDFDPSFLNRFSKDEIVNNRVTFLYESEHFEWNGEWNFTNHSPLWNYNLHYFEYLFPLVKGYQDTHDEVYLSKIKSCILNWIQFNPVKKKGYGWNPYTISLRLTNWLSCYSYLEEYLHSDKLFYHQFIDSVWQQFNYLSRHLEKCYLGNHYFENLKTIILCSIFFNDMDMLQVYLKELKKECQEQILSDGMHFELSPMYHNIILEDMLKITKALRGVQMLDSDLESYLQRMLNCAYSLEGGLKRIPLFNDCGNNISKSLDALCQASFHHFQLIPKDQSCLETSGYYIFQKDDIKIIVDAGNPGPSYLASHSHCDAMSLEVFKNGEPVLVNCGTYAYQCPERSFFRSTMAHNTVMVEGVEQSQCWGVFRMGKRSSIHVLESGDNYLKMRLQDYRGNYIDRIIEINESIIITDSSKNRNLTSFYHFLDNQDVSIVSDCLSTTEDCLYAEDFGQCCRIKNRKFFGKNYIQVEIKINSVVKKKI